MEQAITAKQPASLQKQSMPTLPAAHSQDLSSSEQVPLHPHEIAESQQVSQESS